MADMGTSGKEAAKKAAAKVQAATDNEKEKQQRFEKELNHMKEKKADFEQLRQKHEEEEAKAVKREKEALQRRKHEEDKKLRREKKEMEQKPPASVWGTEAKESFPALVFKHEKRETKLEAETPDRKEKREREMRQGETTDEPSERHKLNAIKNFKERHQAAIDRQAAHARPNTREHDPFSLEERMPDDESLKETRRRIRQGTPFQSFASRQAKKDKDVNFEGTEERLARRNAEVRKEKERLRTDAEKRQAEERARRARNNARIKQRAEERDPNNPINQVKPLGLDPKKTKKDEVPLITKEEERKQLNEARKAERQAEKDKQKAINEAMNQNATGYAEAAAADAEKTRREYEQTQRDEREQREMEAVKAAEERAEAQQKRELEAAGIRQEMSERRENSAKQRAEEAARAAEQRKAAGAQREAQRKQSEAEKRDAEQRAREAAAQRDLEAAQQEAAMANKQQVNKQVMQPPAWQVKQGAATKTEGEVQEEGSSVRGAVHIGDGASEAGRKKLREAAPFPFLGEEAAAGTEATADEANVAEHTDQAHEQEEEQVARSMAERAAKGANAPMNNVPVGSSRPHKKKKRTPEEIAAANAAVAEANAAAAKELQDANNAAIKETEETAEANQVAAEKLDEGVDKGEGDAIAAANDAAAKEMAYAHAAASQEAVANQTAIADEIAAANDAATKELADANIAAPATAGINSPSMAQRNAEAGSAQFQDALDSATADSSSSLSLHRASEDDAVAIEEEDLKQQEEQEKEEEEADDPDGARKAWREKWANLKTGGNSERLGNLLDLWFVAGTLAGTQSRGSSHSPFTVGSSLAELQRRSPLREDNWACLDADDAVLGEGPCTWGVCHEEPEAPQQMCFSRFLLGRRPVNGTAITGISDVNANDQLWWIYNDNLVAQIAQPVGAELRSQMHLYATHYNRALWPQTAKKMSMAADHLVVHYHVGDVAVGSVLSPKSLIKAIELLTPAPSTVEILSGGIKHDAECMEAMDAYLQRQKQSRKNAQRHGFAVTSALGTRLEAAKTDPALRKQMVDECRSKSIEMLDRLRAGIQKGLPNADIIFDTAGMSTVDEDFFKMAAAPMLVVGGGSLGMAAALASRSQQVRSPACGPDGCLWLQLTRNTANYAREIRPGWHTYPYVMEEADA